jgi:hypothetical protein
LLAARWRVTLAAAGADDDPAACAQAELDVVNLDAHDVGIGTNQPG